MDFDTEAADDFRRAVKRWEDGLTSYLSYAGATDSDCESDTGLITPPPDCQQEEVKSWGLPPPRPIYADSWVRVMKRRAQEGHSCSSDTDSDTSSIASGPYSNDYESDLRHADTIVTYGSQDSVVSTYGPLLTSADSNFDGSDEGSTATIADAEDLLAEMLDTYTVPKHFKTAISRQSDKKRQRTSGSSIRRTSSGILKRKPIHHRGKI